MILPTKHLPESRSLIGVGATVLLLLERQGATVSGLWDEFKDARGEKALVSYDWFVMGLDLLFMLDAIEIQKGVIVRKSK